MQTTLDIPRHELEQWEELGKEYEVSPEELMRTMLSNFLSAEIERKKAIDQAFGMWADRGIDGLEYQLKMRAEWDHRP